MAWQIELKTGYILVFLILLIAKCLYFLVYLYASPLIPHDINFSVLLKHFTSAMLLVCVFILTNVGCYCQSVFWCDALTKSRALSCLRSTRSCLILLRCRPLLNWQAAVIITGVFLTLFRMVCCPLWAVHLSLMCSFSWNQNSFGEAPFVSFGLIILG